LGVGNSLSLLYRLQGSLPAGDYHVHVDGYTSASDAKLDATLLARSAGAADRTLGVVPSTPPPATAGAHLATWIDGTLTLPAESADAIVLVIHYTSGSSPFTVIETSLTIP
jgi:hypothetical protein